MSGKIRSWKQPTWKGKTAVVCGGSSGLGYAIAEELVRQDIGHLILISRKSDQLQSAAEQLRNVVTAPGRTHARKTVQLGALPKISSLTADLADVGSVCSAVEQLSALEPRVDLLIQAVGSSDRGTINKLTRQRLIELIDSNVVTNLHAVQHFQPFLKEASGVMVMIGSLSSLFAPRYLGGYSIAKHGLAALAQQARLELADEGIHVMLCCPGPITRADAGRRYSSSCPQKDIPEEARLPGGGAKVSGLCPDELARDILRAAGRRETLLIRPRKAWWLRLIGCVFPRLGERILRSRSS